MPRIHVEVGATRHRHGTRFWLDGPAILVGRDPQCDLYVKSDSVSRRHLSIVLSQERWLVQDLDSANGTYLNRRRVGEAELRVRDVLRLGEAGPKIHVLSLDPPPAGGDDPDLEATRHVSSAAGVYAPAPEAEAEVRGPARAPTNVTPWLVFAGLWAGLATGLRVWPDAFPYDAVTGPFQRLPHEWAVAAALGLYGALLGAMLGRPARRWPVLLVLLVAHAALFFGLRGPPPRDAVPAARAAVSGIVLESARLVRRGETEELLVQDAYRIEEAGRATKLALAVDVADGAVRVRARLEPDAAARGILSYALRRQIDDDASLEEARDGGAFERRTRLTTPDGAVVGVTGHVARRQEVDAIEATAELALDADAVVVVECEGNALGETSTLALRLAFRRVP